MQRLTKSTKIVSSAVLALCLATGAAFAGSNYQYGGQYGYHNTNREIVTNVIDVTTASGPQTGIVSDLSQPYFQENYADQLADSDYSATTVLPANIQVFATATATQNATAPVSQIIGPYVKRYP